MELCPADAISKSEGTGLVSIDSAKCIGCELCLQCPLGGIDIDEKSGLAVNCDLCNSKPACVEFCPGGALQYVLTAEARRTRIATIQPV
jgi:phenylglyoxylate dehydrogenase beta subunit